MKITGNHAEGEGMSEKYDELLELLHKAEMEARNGAWATCGSWCRNAMKMAFKFDSKDDIPATTRKENQ